MDSVKKAKICVTSCIDGEEIYNDYIGEYALKKGVYNIVFTGYYGNVLTKTGIQANDNLMLVHRKGGISGDMVFDPLTDTVFKYEAVAVRKGFILHTYRYEIKNLKNKIVIFAEYGLNDGSGEKEIRGKQKIEIITYEEGSKKSERN